MSVFNPSMPGAPQGGSSGGAVRPKSRFGSKSPLRQQMQAQAQQTMHGMQATPNMQTSQNPSATMAGAAAMMMGGAGIAGEQAVSGGNFASNLLEKANDTGILDTVAERGLGVLSGQESLKDALRNGISDIAEKNGREDIGFNINKVLNSGSLDVAAELVSQKMTESSNAKVKALGYFTQFASLAAQLVDKPDSNKTSGG